MNFEISVRFFNMTYINTEINRSQKQYSNELCDPNKHGTFDQCRLTVGLASNIEPPLLECPAVAGTLADVQCSYWYNHIYLTRIVHNSKI